MNLTRPSRPGVLVAGLCLYSVLSLISMAMMNIGAGILGICIVAAWGGFSRLGERFKALFSGAPSLVRKFAWVSAAFAASCVLSLAVGKAWPLVVAGHVAHIRVLGDSAKIWYFAWPFVLWFALSACTVQERKKVLLSWFWAFAILSVIGIVQHYTGWPRRQPIPPLYKTFHAILFLGHHLTVASVMIFPFFALLDLRRSPFGREWARWLCLSLALVMLFFTYSRMLWIALPIGLVFWGFLRFGKRAKIAILLLSVLGGYAAFHVPAVHDRLTAQMGIQEREDLWEANWKFFRERPVTGVGFKRNQELSGLYLQEKYHREIVFEGHAHDNVLDVLGSMGLVGLICFVAWWVLLVALLVSALRGSPSSSVDHETFFAKGLLAALLVFQLNGLTQVNFWDAKVQHQLMWMVAWALLWYSEKSSAGDRN